MSSVTTQNHSPASAPSASPSPLPPYSPRRSQRHAQHVDLPTDLPPDAGRAAAGIAIVLVAQLMLVLDASVVNVGLPRIDADLSFGPAGLSWVLNAYTLAFGGLLLLGGRLGDVLGRRRMFEIGIAVFTLASVAGGLAQSPGWLVASRAVQGAGAAMAAPGVLALLTTSAPDEAARNRALALFGAVTSGGLSIGLILGGIVTDLGSWRWTLFINVPIGLALLALTRRYLSETARRPGRFDVVGAVTATLGAVSIVWALIGAPDHGWWSVQTVGGFVVGAALLTVLFFTERRVAHPMLQPALLRNRQRVSALAVMMLVVGAQFSMFFLVVQYTQRVLGFGPLLSGMAFLPLTLGIFAMSRVSPRLLAEVRRQDPGGHWHHRDGDQLRLARARRGHRRNRLLREHDPRADAAQRLRGRSGLHAGDLDRPAGRGARARRVGLGAAPDRPAARWGGRPGRDRFGVRRRGRAG